ncbi:acetyl-CoA carboxylase biotin carboxyl carrier protein [Roseomonas terrae]|uniref:Biotin carboxyl carrier protein of acetyl-CoA carboxylase n=2 Tax=Neoroseomonas terrae TaxID=424799 RepID=A0ABS5EBC9_9PROT|nr:acetyl-CoA carboxylase biotin carboxyl carrier protein [Neoroseomonas terrae]
MDLAKIKALIDLVSRSQVTELELTEGDSTLRLGRSSAAGPARPIAASAATAPAPAAPVAPAAEVAPQPASPEEAAVRSPSFGVFHRTPAPDAPPFVTVGATVEAGQTLCLIEAMKVFTAIAAPHGGTVEAILAESGEEVEAGQPLFRLRA